MTDELEYYPHKWRLLIKNFIFPTIIMIDRYKGLFTEGKKWFAVLRADRFYIDGESRATYVLTKGPSSDNVNEATEFWQKIPNWIVPFRNLWRYETNVLRHVKYYIDAYGPKEASKILDGARYAQRIRSPDEPPRRPSPRRLDS